MTPAAPAFASAPRAVRGRRRRRSAGSRSPSGRAGRRGGPRRSARRARASRSNVAPAASAPCEARWSVAPSASGSEYGQADLEQVGAGVDRRAGDREATSRRPGSRRRRTGSSAARPSARGPCEGGGDAAGAGGVVRVRRRGRRGRRPGHRSPPTAPRRRTARGPPGPCRRGRRTRRRTTASSGYGDARPLEPGQQLGQRRDGVRRLERRQDPLGPGRRPSSPRSPRGPSPCPPPCGRPRRAPPAAARRPGSRGRPTRLCASTTWPSRSWSISEREPWRMPGVPPAIAAAWRPVAMPSPAASATARRTDGSPMNRASSPIAFEPPPTQASARSGSRPSTARSWAAASSPMRRWRSRTIVGYGCGPIAEPST